MSVSMQLRLLIEQWVAAQDYDEVIEARRADLEASNNRLRELALQGRRLKETHISDEVDQDRRPTVPHRSKN
jgi:hypothetical protein